ncbi:molybdopterin-guanine dinucleotide biosynthesis protein B [Paracoccaceae bacterium GXU_MW_L88]
MKVFGITGSKNSGKTTLCERLIKEFHGQGYRVSVVKTSEKSLVDAGGSDAGTHLAAGAMEFVESSPEGFSMTHALRGAPEPQLDFYLPRMAAADLVLVDGYMKPCHPRLECRRGGQRREDLSQSYAKVVAIAADFPIEHDLPVFDLNDIAGLAKFVMKEARNVRRPSQR